MSTSIHSPILDIKATKSSLVSPRPHKEQTHLLLDRPKGGIQPNHINTKTLEMHIDKVKQFWVKKQLQQQQQKQEAEVENEIKEKASVKYRSQRQMRQVVRTVPREKYNALEEFMQERTREGQYITKDGREDQVKYMRGAHFNLGFQKGFQSETTSEERNLLWKLTDRPVQTVPGISIVQDYDEKRTKSNIRMGTSKDANNRKDTSFGSQYGMKTVDDKESVNVRQVVREMRRTNFILGFKSEQKHKEDLRVSQKALEPSEITVINEVEEPPASVLKNAKNITEGNYQKLKLKLHSNMTKLKKHSTLMIRSKKKNLQSALSPRTHNKGDSNIYFGGDKSQNMKVTTHMDTFKSLSNPKILSETTQSNQKLAELQNKTNFALGFNQEDLAFKEEMERSSVLRNAINYWKQRFENQTFLDQHQNKNQSSILQEGKQQQKLSINLRRIKAQEHFQTMTREKYGAMDETQEQGIGKQLRVIKKQLPNLLNFSNKLNGLPNITIARQDAAFKMKTETHFQLGRDKSEHKSHSQDVHSIQVHEFARTNHTSLSPLRKDTVLIGTQIFPQQKYQLQPTDVKAHSTLQLRRLNTPQFSQFRQGPISGNRLDSQRSQTKSAFEDYNSKMKDFHAYDHDKDKSAYDDLKGRFNEIKDSYSKTNFTLGYHQGLGTQKLDEDGNPITNYGTQSLLQTETKQQFQQYDPNIYQSPGPRCQTNHMNQRKKINHFAQVQINGQDNLHYGTVKQKMMEDLVTPRYQLQQEQPLSGKKANRNIQSSSFKLSYIDQEKPMSAMKNSDLLQEKALMMVNEARMAYMINNTSHVDNVRSTLQSSNRPRTMKSKQRNDIRSTNSDFFKWIQPVPAPLNVKKDAY